MARYPLHPRLGRLIVEARRRGVAAKAVRWRRCSAPGERLPARAPHATRSDLLVLMEGEWSPYAARLVRQLGGSGARRPPGRGGTRRCAAAQRPGRVSRSRGAAAAGRANCNWPSGAAAEQAPNSTVTGAELLVAVEAEDRRDQKAPVVRLASAIEPEWLLDLFPERLREVSTLEWNRAGERVEAVRALMFDQIAIETRRTPPDPEAAGALLAHKAVEAGLARFADPEEIAAFQSRVQLRGGTWSRGPAGRRGVEAALASLATGLKSFAELETAARGADCCAPSNSRCRPERAGSWTRSRRVHPSAARAAGAASTTSPISRPGSRPACRISSACARRPPWRGARSL